MKKVLLQIHDMHCSSCAMNIDFDLEDVEGIKTCKTSYVKQLCEVEFNEKILSQEDIMKQIKKIGYNATVKNL